MADEKMQRFQLVVQPSLLGEVDQWRAKQPGLPNRSEAIRQLVTRGLTVKDDDLSAKKQD